MMRIAKSIHTLLGWIRIEISVQLSHNLQFVEYEFRRFSEKSQVVLG